MSVTRLVKKGVQEVPTMLDRVVNFSMGDIRMRKFGTGASKDKCYTYALDFLFLTTESLGRNCNS